VNSLTFGSGGFAGTFVDIARPRKCLVTPVSIARRYAASRVSKHMFDVGGKGWIGIDVVPELACRDAKLDRKPEDVDEHLALMLYAPTSDVVTSR
jgi:hypothetical protein